MIIIYIILILIVIAICYFFTRKPPEKQKQPQFNQQISPTKCFDCINNNRSLNHLNVSHGYPRVYAT